MTRLLELCYRNLGRWYVVLAIPAVMSVTFLVALGGVALLWIYADLSGPEFGRIVAVAEAVVLVEVLVSLRVAFKRLAPARPWLGGERTPQTAVAAWRTLLRLPLHLVRGPIAAMAVVDIAVVSLFIVWELEQPVWPALPGVMAGAAVVVLYGAFLRFFALELALRPVLADVSREVPDRGFEGERQGVAEVAPAGRPPGREHHHGRHRRRPRDRRATTWPRWGSGWPSPSPCRSRWPSS